MTMVEGNRPPRTTAGTSELPYQWDQLQYEHGEGPCLGAIAANGVELVPDLRTENRWPLFTRAIVDQTPARSMLSFRLFLTEQNRAALNLYATRPGAFTDQSTATGSIFAAYASMALLAAARHDTANHLTRALETNREIGVAMGILMANGKLTSPQAFDQLRTASQNFNRKLHDIAADVALTGALPRAVPSSSNADRPDGHLGQVDGVPHHLVVLSSLGGVQLIAVNSSSIPRAVRGTPNRNERIISVRSPDDRSACML